MRAAAIAVRFDMQVGFLLHEGYSRAEIVQLTGRPAQDVRGAIGRLREIVPDIERDE